MFFVKKILSRFLFPLPVVLDFLLVGLFLLWFTRRQRWGKALITVGATMLWAFSMTWSSDVLLRPLERHYDPLHIVHTAGTPSHVTLIAVLGGLANHDPGVPLTSRIAPDQMVRLVEGVYLQRQIPGSKLILSGDHDSAWGMTYMAEELGVRPEDVIRLANPQDTEEECRQIAPLVGSQPFILVTSASHMPRAMEIFQRKGLRPIPAATDYLAPQRRWESDDAIPGGYSLYKSQVAIYEYLGLVWEAIRAKL